MSLSDLALGQKAKVIKILGNEKKFKTRMTDMGFIPGCVVSLNRVAPFGDPIEVSLHGYKLSLGKQEASKIEVEV